MSESVVGISNRKKADVKSDPEEVRAGTINRLNNDRHIGLLVRAKFGLVRFILGTWAKFFGLTGLYWLGNVFSAVEFLINRSKRRRYRRVLEKVFPDGISGRRTRKLTRRYFRRTRCDKFFYLIYDKLPRNKVLSRIHFHGRDHLDHGLSRGQGVYMAMSHHGSHHVLGMLLSLLGYRLTGIRDRNEGILRSYIQQSIGKTLPEFDACQVLFSDDFPREIFRCFRENRLVLSALDVGRARGMRLKTADVTILGETREFLTGTMQIALRCNGVIIPTFLVSRPNFHYRIVVLPPIYVPSSTKDVEPPALNDLMQAYASHIEAHIRKYPDHISRI